MIKYSIKNKLIFIFMTSCLIFNIGCSKQSVKKTSNSKSVISKASSVSKINDTKDIKKNDEATFEKEYIKAYTLFFQHKYEESIKICDEIIKKDSKFYKAYNTKGISLCFLNDFENGLKNINKSLEIKPNFGYGRFNKALAYELYGYYDESLKWYDKALEIENYIWSYYGKASIYGRLGDVDNTIKYLKIALSMDSTIKDTIKSERDFDPVRNDPTFKDLVK
ncbi:tetratricopeptide repeat protein [Clostridium massiliodielmoense]|uniref:tetratricopeptide repeat protein n=1 Tax=Clostridium massiliodielmoense TaxID=1776385 RepID=UPI0004D5150D|nr:hypothetical protein [Clostridium massiliodielmoense]KEH98498.1 hypothetical protein Z962_11925 [Clostridium botulinum C/D str. BKT12695]